MSLEKRHPKDTGAAKAEALLSHLALDGNAGASTLNYALSALLFLYRDVLGVDLPWMSEVIRAKRSARRPVLRTQRAVTVVLDRISSIHGLMARLLYGTSMRSFASICCRPDATMIYMRALN